MVLAVWEEVVGKAPAFIRHAGAGRGFVGRGCFRSICTGNRAALAVWKEVLGKAHTFNRHAGGVYRGAGRLLQPCLVTLRDLAPCRDPAALPALADLQAAVGLPVTPFGRDLGDAPHMPV